MAVTASRVRKGVFTLKTADDTAAVVFSCHPTSIVLTPEAGDTGDDLEVLCGDSIIGEPSATKWSLVMTSIQAIEAANTDADSLVLYALKNDLKKATFTFKPSPTSKTFTGECTIIAAPIGGEVGGTAPTSEVTWPMTGAPTEVVTPPPAPVAAQTTTK